MYILSTYERSQDPYIVSIKDTQKEIQIPPMLQNVLQPDIPFIF